MPTVEVDQEEGLRASVNNGKLTVSIGLFIKDLDNPFPGAGEHFRLLSAYALSGVPKPEDQIVVYGRRLYARGFELDPWPPADASLKVTYVEDTPTGSTAPVVIESGSTFEQTETHFLAQEMLKPYAQRKPIVVKYEAKWAVGPQFKPQSIPLPCFKGKPFRRYTIPYLGFDPGELAEKYVSRTNLRPWKPKGAKTPYLPEEALCASIIGRESGQGWEGVFDFIIDRETRFHQIGRWTDPQTGERPELTPKDLATNNGILDGVVQLQADFNVLPIPK
jgi:hypothetical protein